MFALSNRGTKVYPNGFDETFCTDHWRARFMSETQGAAISHAQIVKPARSHRKSESRFHQNRKPIYL